MIDGLSGGIFGRVLSRTARKKGFPEPLAPTPSAAKLPIVLAAHAAIRPAAPTHGFRIADDDRKMRWASPSGWSSSPRPGAMAIVAGPIVPLLMADLGHGSTPHCTQSASIPCVVSECGKSNHKESFRVRDSRHRPCANKSIEGQVRQWLLQGPYLVPVVQAGPSSPCSCV